MSVRGYTGLHVDQALSYPELLNEGTILVEYYMAAVYQDIKHRYFGIRTSHIKSTLRYIMLFNSSGHATTSTFVESLALHFCLGITFYLSLTCTLHCRQFMGHSVKALQNRVWPREH